MARRSQRVLHIITGLSTGGAERALYNVISAGLAGQYETALISLRDAGTFGERIEALGVPVHGLGIAGGLPGPRALYHLRHLIGEFRPDVIHGWMYHGNLGASVSARMAPSRPAVAWNVRHSLYGIANEKLLTRQVIRAGRRVSASVDAIVYNSRVSREQHEAFGFDGKRAQVIPNGFDLAEVRSDATIRARVRGEFGVPEDAPLVGNVARFHPMKDHASFLRAAVMVAEAVPEVRFLVVGREVNPDDPALAGIVPPALLDRLCFLGERSDVPDLMRAIDVLCTSSAWGEAFPNVLGEAMACGVPCVATDVGDSADIVADTGIVVPPSDSEALGQGLLAMLGKPLQERAALGRAARARVERNYGSEAVVAQYAELYSRLSTKG